MSTPTAAKLVIVAGQEFSVPVDTDNEAIRKQLQQMGFADVANATIQTGKKPDGTATIEFVKKAGTKGVDIHALTVTLAHVPAAPVTKSQSAAVIASRFAEGDVTWGEAVSDDLDRDMQEYANQQAESDEGCGRPVAAKGVQVCERLDLPAVATAIPAW
jgi:hypothetical protein